MATPLTAIPAHLLEEILLRLPAPDDLARASAACVSFRRLVTDSSFLRQFRRLHAPPLLGFFDHNAFNPALPPHASASGARALARAADFSFRFLPSPCPWAVQDIRDGRVLLVARDPREDERRQSFRGFSVCNPGEDERRQNFRELAVCNPLHKRYILLPPVGQYLKT